MKGWFDQHGRLMCVLRGDIATSPPAGATELDVPDSIDVNRVALMGDALTERQLLQLQTDRTILRADGTDAPLLSCADPDALVEVDGEVMNFAAVPLTADQPLTRTICPTGCHFGPAIVLRYETGSAILAGVRAQRDARLAACDWTLMPDAPLAEAVRLAWQAYRQELRDVPQLQPTATIETVAWPAAPELS
jgi:hypothetical protein